MIFDTKPGIIALDIDGTLTSNTHVIDSEVVLFLSTLNQIGWKFIFITGRPFQWGIETLKVLPFSYALAVQNGALLLEMPLKKILSRQYLTNKILPDVDVICREQQTDFVIYSGLENADWCYYRPEYLEKSLLTYMLERSIYLGEKWQAIKNFSQLPMTHFSSVKFFAKEKQAFILSQTLEKQLNVHAPPNRDPFNPNYFVIQATNAHATKGYVLKEYIKLTRFSGPIIAAGDDHNDYSMLKIADIKIVMENAPEFLLTIADVIAPSAAKQGIIDGLNKALQCLSQRI